MPGPKRYPYHLFPSDKFNVMPGILLYFVLATSKDWKVFPWFVRWQLNHYTNWNLLLIILGELLQQHQWSGFLFAQSLGVLVGFRTAMANGILENMKKRMNEYSTQAGFPHHSNFRFAMIDHCVHTLPPVLLGARLVRDQKRIPFITTTYAMLSFTWGAFRQQAKLDSSGIYVPHPWRRAWIGIATGVFTSRWLIAALVKRDRRQILLAIAILTVPWCTTRFDPGLRKKYAFEYAVSRVNSARDPGRQLSDRRLSGGPARPKKSESWSVFTSQVGS